MNTHMHRFRKIALAFAAMAVCSLFFANSCQKQELNLTPEQLDSINAHSIDYALQVIPDIHKVIPNELLDAMDSIPQKVVNAAGEVIPNSQGEDSIVYISALYFGDNPPNLVRMDGNDTLGFFDDGFVVEIYIPTDTSTHYAHSTYPGKVHQCKFYFRFYDQHRGVAKVDFKSNYVKEHESSTYYAYEISHVTDSVFIMGDVSEGVKRFTAYYSQKRVKNSSFGAVDFGEHDAVVLSGEITEAGIKNLYFGFKTLGYSNPDPDAEVMSYVQGKDDILVLHHKNFIPFSYWNPYLSYDN